MRALVVGCGYVGLALGAELAKRGHEVVGLRRTAASQSELKAAGIRLLLADITKPEYLAKCDPAYDWVANCVASSGGGPEEYRAVYLQGTRNLLAWLSAAPPKKFVYTSSTSVYAQTDGSVVTETSPAEPAVETAKTLLETERVLLAAAHGSSFPAVILRVAGIYGPGRGHWLKQYLKGEATIEGAGDRVLNMIHRDDVVGAILAALDRGRPGEIYNAVDDEPVRQRDLFQWLAGRLRRPLPVSSPVEENASSKRGLTSKRVSNDKIKVELGHRFKHPTFREGLEAELGSFLTTEHPERRSRNQRDRWF
ncbi:NAD-dependent epimerase/dehydratase [Verrucomicrobia bacterium]|nr:NAD-dependent epimerase/dehydratase [Verrucomicrobiota bacterium]